MPLNCSSPKVPLKSETVLSIVNQCKQVVPIHLHKRQQIYEKIKLQKSRKRQMKITTYVYRYHELDQILQYQNSHLSI